MRRSLTAVRARLLAIFASFHEIHEYFLQLVLLATEFTDLDSRVGEDLTQELILSGRLIPDRDLPLHMPVDRLLRDRKHPRQGSQVLLEAFIRAAEIEMVNDPARAVQQ